MSSTLQLKNIKRTQQHPFHVLTSSKLPLFMSIFVGSIALIFVAKLHNVDYITSFDYSIVASQIFSPLFEIAGGLYYLPVDVFILYLLWAVLITMAGWSYNLIKESTKEGRHTLRVQLALKYGMLLFLVSEAMLFFPFF